MKINGLKKINIKIIKNKKGDIIKYLSSKDKFLKSLGKLTFLKLKKDK